MTDITKTDFSTKEMTMRVTRKALQAENDQLRAQLAVHNHVTRSELHRMLKQITERNAHLVEEYAKLERSYKGLEQLLTPQPKQQAA